MELVTLLGLSKAFLDRVPGRVLALRASPRPSPPDGTDDQAAANEARWLAGHWTPDAAGRRTVGPSRRHGLSWPDLVERNCRDRPLDRARRGRARRDRRRHLLQPLRLAEEPDQGRLGEHRHRAPPPVRPHPEPGRDRARATPTHEREVFEEVTRARATAAGATGSPAAQAAAEGPFVAALGKLFAVAENYPDLKANQNFLALQTRALQHRGSPADRAALLQRERPRVQPAREGSSRRRSSPACSTSSKRSSSRSTRRSARPARRRWTSRPPATRAPVAAGGAATPAGAADACRRRRPRRRPTRRPDRLAVSRRATVGPGGS